MARHGAAPGVAGPEGEDWIAPVGVKDSLAELSKQRFIYMMTSNRKVLVRMVVIIEGLGAALQALQDQLEGGDGWRGIESAPDGVPIDLWRDGERMFDFTRDPKTRRWERKHGYPAVTTVLMIEPTHWRPIPAPPLSDAEGG